MVAFVFAEEAENKQKKRGLELGGFGEHDFGGDLGGHGLELGGGDFGGHDLGGHEKVHVNTVTKQVPYLVPKPVPYTVIKKVPVPYKVRLVPQQSS